MKRLFLATLAILLASCATGYSPMYRYDQVRVLNNSDRMLSNLVIQDQNSGRTLDCGDIGGFGFCQHPIPKLRYQSLPLDVSWTAQGGDETTQSVVPASKGPYVLGNPLQVEVNFAEDGTLSAVLKQESLSIR